MCRHRRPRWVVIFLRSPIATDPRQVMSGMERQIAELSGREESTTSLARESKQKARETRLPVAPTRGKLPTMGTSFLCSGSLPSLSDLFLFYFFEFVLL